MLSVSLNKTFGCCWVVGWLGCWLAGLLAGWVVGWLGCWLAGLLVGCVVGSSII